MQKIEQTLLQKIKRFFEPLQGNGKITVVYILYFFIETGFGVLFIFFLRDFVAAIEHGNIEAVFPIIKMYIAAFFIMLLVIMFFRKGWTYSYNRYRTTIEKKYLSKFVQLDSNSLEKIGTGKSIAIISGGINMWGGLLDRIIIQTVQMLISIIITIYFLIQINLILVTLLIILLFVGQLLGHYVNKKIITIRKNRIELSNQWSRGVVKIIMSKMEILQSQKIQSEINLLHDNHEKQIYYNGQMATYLVPFFCIGNVIVMIILCTSFYYFTVLFLKGEILLSSIAALSGALMLMQKEFINSLDFIKNLGKEFSQVQNLWDFFDDTPLMTGYENGHEFQIQSGSITLSKLSYGYDEKTTVFKNFDLKLKGGNITALVGPSGGGKSTLVKLIAGYIRAQSGEIIIDEQKLSETSLKSYYKEIGYLTQEPSVFDGTIRDNLSYALEEEVSDSKMNEVLKQAGCDFIFEFPDGIDTEIGEKGIRLSGGQRQRLAIAKIFLKDPHIIILDEPTSALDSFSEAKIAAAMERLFRGRTVVVIAHRLQTVKHADDIIYIKDGEIIERGNHQELVKQGGLYKQMLDLQSGF